MRPNTFIAAKNYRCGFTLLEVLVALAVLSIALIGIYRLHGQTMMMSGSSRFYNLAPKLAQSMLADTERKPFNDIADGSGDFGDAYPGYAWALSVEDLPSELISSEKYHLVRLSLTVTQNDEYQYQMHTYRFLYEE